MHSLRATKKVKKLVGGKSKKPVLLDLDNDEDGDIEDEGIAECEKAAMEKLDRALSGCQKCGPTKACKINKLGEHVALTYNQHRGWSVALVSLKGLC